MRVFVTVVLLTLVVNSACGDELSTAKLEYNRARKEADKKLYDAYNAAIAAAENKGAAADAEALRQEKDRFVSRELSILKLLIDNHIAPSSSVQAREAKKATASTNWKAVVGEYIKKQGRLISIDQFYNPESLVGAVIKIENVWFDARGRLSSAAFGPAGSGEGYCDYSCKLGVRVEYTVDEGFGRSTQHDRVFFLTELGTVTGFVPTEIIRFESKAVGIHSSDAEQDEAIGFLSNMRGAKGKRSRSSNNNRP